MKNNLTKKYYAFYGSLRVGEYNYDRLLKDKPGVDYVKTITLPKGYLLYSLGAYPMVIEDETSEFPLVLDLFEIDAPNISKWIDMMEIGAGYTPTTIVIDNVAYCLFVGDYKENSQWLKSNSIVTSGDWTEEIKRRKIKSGAITNES